MTRSLPLHPKILRCSHQPHAKQLLPQPIHNHPRRQRMTWIHQPLRQTQPVFRPVRRHRRQTGRSLRGDNLPRLRILTTHQNSGLTRHQQLLHHQRRHRLLLQFSQRFHHRSLLSHHLHSLCVTRLPMLLQPASLSRTSVRRSLQHNLTNLRRQCRQLLSLQLLLLPRRLLSLQTLIRRCQLLRQRPLPALQLHLLRLLLHCGQGEKRRCIAANRSTIIPDALLIHTVKKGIQTVVVFLRECIILMVYTSCL